MPAAAVEQHLAVDFVPSACLDLVRRAFVAAVVAVLLVLVVVDFVPADCLDPLARAFAAVVAVVAVVRPAAGDFVPAAAILAAVPGFGLVAYFYLVGCAVGFGLAAYFVLVAEVRPVDPVAVALYLYLDDLVAVRKSERRHREAGTQSWP